MLQIVNVPRRNAPAPSATPENTAHQEATNTDYMNGMKNEVLLLRHILYRMLRHDEARSRASF